MPEGAAAHKLASGVEAMGLDRFLPVLRAADDHLTRSGGILALMRELPAPTAPAAPSAPRPAAPSAPGPGPLPSLPPPVQLGAVVRLALRGLLLGGAAALLDADTGAEEAGQLRAVFERFGLDPSKPEDVAAATAFRWAQFKGPWQIGGPATGPAMQAMAESVMRAVRADPALLAGLLSGDAKTLEAVRSVVQATASGGQIVTRNAEERQLVAEMTKAGKSRKEIEDALDALRKSRGEAGRMDVPNDPDDWLRKGWNDVTHPGEAAKVAGFSKPTNG